MSNKRYDDLIKVLAPRPNPQQPYGPTPGHGQQPPGAAYPGQPYPPAGPFYHGNAPISQPPMMPPYNPPGEPGPVEPWMPNPRPNPRPQPEKQGPSGLDLAMIIFGAACFIILLAAMLPE